MTTWSIGPQLHPCLRPGVLFAAAVNTRLAGAHVSGECPASTSSFALGALRLWVRVTLPGVNMDSEDPEGGPHTWSSSLTITSPPQPH